MGFVRRTQQDRFGSDLDGSSALIGQAESVSMWAPCGIAVDLCSYVPISLHFYLSWTPI